MLLVSLQWEIKRSILISQNISLIGNGGDLAPLPPIEPAYLIRYKSLLKDSLSVQ